MSNERAREVLTKEREMTEEKIEYYRQRGEDIPSAKELAQALDIAIESLENEWQTGTPKESGYYLVTNGANKVDIRKYDNGWYHDMYRRYTNEELEVIAWKKVEPYERKE